ncbi:MAG: N-acetylmuramoyl-L-alanine amidase [Patescibacteria group bacterium]
MKRILFIITVFVIFLGAFSTQAGEEKVESFCPAVFSKIRILLVPGHNNEEWGAQYGNLKESYMNLAVAVRVYNLLKKDERFEVFITRDEDGYLTEFSDYFNIEKDNIILFKEDARNEIWIKILNGTFIQKVNPPHNTASSSASLRLYGINKWANENKIDAVINMHFNDYKRKNKWTIGKYRGFVIYMPEEQMANSKKSVNLAENIFLELNKKYSVSNYIEEKKGIVPDQKLIALGVNNTLNETVRSVVIEYGYIYEKIFRNSFTRHKSYETFAELTVKGIANSFFE